MTTTERMLLENRRFQVIEKSILLPGGDTATCQFVRHSGSVAILPILDDGRICLIRSRRVTVDETLIEIPAGTREPGEAPLVTAERELAEETGFRLGHLGELISYYPSPGMLSEKMWIFVARGLTPGEPAREANEEIENFIVPWEDALAMIQRGEIRDGKTIIALLTHERSYAGRAII